MLLLLVPVLGLLVIAGATALGPRLGLASPLLLVGVGVLVSLLPAMPDLQVPPELILAGILPPLLYSASVSMPAMDFRRDFTAIGGMSVILVVVSTVVLGVFFANVIPGVSLGWGLALGAIVSPTDAVATSIARRLGVAPRAVSILEGESLLNDGTALVLLRAAIAGAAASSAHFGGIIGSFFYDVAVAVLIGVLVGRLNLAVRSRVSDPTVNTVLSLTVPFIAYLPVESLGASGLVAAVAAGLVTGHRAPRMLSPQHRQSDAQNWRTVEMVLEGAIFLVMGLEIRAVVGDVRAEHAGIGTALTVAAGALALTLLVRAACVAPLFRALGARTRRGERLKPRIETLHSELGDKDSRKADFWRSRLRRQIADIDYFLAVPLGWREGSVLVWAGMRGAVTVAAAQTLPIDTPNRSVLVFIAFAVAAGSLLVQGGTLPWVIALVKPAGPDPEAERAEREELAELLTQAAGAATPRPGVALELSVIEAQREALLEARDHGTFSSALLTDAMASLDARQISQELG